jgi:hypothetical protein
LNQQGRAFAPAGQGIRSCLLCASPVDILTA